MSPQEPGSPPFTLYGEGRSDPRAASASAAAYRALRRYVNEVVAAFKLCPFLHDPATGLGKVGMVLDREPDLETSLAALVELGGPVIHLVYPVTTMSAHEFERFGAKLASSLGKRLPRSLVHATFHPEMAGGLENANRLVGLVRQAPDPFLQFIPEGFENGGTVMVGHPVPPPRYAQTRFETLAPADLAALTARIAEIKRDRADRLA